jgi:hypothetical protein
MWEGMLAFAKRQRVLSPEQYQIVDDVTWYAAANAVPTESMACDRRGAIVLGLPEQSIDRIGRRLHVGWRTVYWAPNQCVALLHHSNLKRGHNSRAICSENSVGIELGG